MFVSNEIEYDERPYRSVSKIMLNMTRKHSYFLYSPPACTARLQPGSPDPLTFRSPEVELSDRSPFSVEIKRRLSQL
jgi:hypothetical protein